MLYVLLLVGATVPKRKDSFKFLAGSQDCAVDDKRRFSMPPKFRGAFPVVEIPNAGVAHPAYLGPWFRRTLALFPMKVWERFAHGMMRLDYTTPAVDAHKAGILAHFEPVHTDPEGRLTLTPAHCEYIGLEPGKKGRVVVVGDGGICRIWEMETYAKVHQPVSLEDSLRALTDEVRKIDPEALTFSFAANAAAPEENEEPEEDDED